MGGGAFGEGGEERFGVGGIGVEFCGRGGWCWVACSYLVSWCLVPAVWSALVGCVRVCVCVCVLAQEILGSVKAGRKVPIDILHQLCVVYMMEPCY